jgi:hypothetical protein
LVGASGLVLLSLSIAYVLPVVNAAVQKRQVASYISTLGHSAEEVLERAWNDEDFGYLHLHYIALGPMVNELAERHLAYPILHYFHSVERHTAIGPSIAVLDESLTLLECCVPDVQLAPSATLPIGRSITEFLDTLREAFVTKADEPPAPPPKIGELRERGIPVLGEDDVETVFGEAEARRALLLALVQHDAWSWDELPTSRRQVDEAIMEAADPAPVPDEELDTSVPQQPAGE